MFEEMSDGGLFREEHRFTKAEVADLIDTRVRVALEIANAFPAHALLIKTLDGNLSTDPFGGAIRDEGHTLQKRARSQFYGLKKSLNEDELQIVRSYFAANPSILSTSKEVSNCSTFILDQRCDIKTLLKETAANGQRQKKRQPHKEMSNASTLKLEDYARG